MNWEAQQNMDEDVEENKDFYKALGEVETRD